MAFPAQLFAVELPKGSDQWHALSAVNAAEVAGVLRDAGYTVRPFVPVVSLMEATGQRRFIRHAAQDARVSEGKAQDVIRSFIQLYAQDAADGS